MRVATKTKELIDKKIEEDNGNLFRKLLRDLLPQMDDAYRQDKSPFRSHFGFSTAGEECEYKLWSSWRWVNAKIIPGRIQRLFNRGHLEEARFLASLMCAGFQVFYAEEDGGQFKISHFAGHAGSAVDGVVLGIPELPEGTAALLEMKTHSEKYFNALVKNGVKREQWKHYVQMQIYMHKLDLKWALYCAVNKNTDEYHFEIIAYDAEVASRYIQRSGNILYSKDSPSKESASSSFWKCRFCDFLDTCHNDGVPSINCRTCVNASPVEDGTWHCSHHNRTLSKEKQEAGCQDHLFHPGLYNAQVIDHSREDNSMTIEWKEYPVKLGKGGYTSKEFKGLA
ncbi:exonuclease [Shewanella phage S0112]|nr:exonuclease [Shewanella phage S0112]